ncbi:MAG: hypothetical protein KKA62_05925, partial [Nanoarchaeota archaeon]|nr:hypothetical protein [Nanoarchaeota archaeon]MBU1977462.1 hypothetical protein [Nanoarchaeota archaeon]
MKKVVSLLVLVILISSFSFAQNETVVEDSCSGVWGTISCFFWGNPDARPIAGQAWSDRGALVGEAKRYSVTYTDASGISQSTIVETTDPNSAKMGVINELSKDKACLN